MSNSIYKVPFPKNEKVLSYKHGSEEKKLVLFEYKKMLKRRQKIFSWIKPIVKVGFWFFLFKGLIWLLLLYIGVGIL